MFPSHDRRMILFSEVGIVVMIGSFLLGVVVPFFDMKKDIALIQQSIESINNNHEAHIQDILDQIKEIKEKQLRQDEIVIQLLQR